jgi:hypothetical protein
MELTISKLLFQAFPETLAIASLALVLGGLKLKLKSILFVGVLQTIAAYLVRLLDLGYGVHTIILISTLAFFLYTVLKIKLSRSILVALLSIIILAVAETVLVTLILKITGAEFNEVTENPTLWILLGWPQIIFIFLLALVINRWHQKCRLGNDEANA